MKLVLILATFALAGKNRENREKKREKKRLKKLEKAEKKSIGARVITDPGNCCQELKVIQEGKSHILLK